MTNANLPSLSPDQTALHALLAELTGLLGNCAQSAEQRVRRAGAMIRSTLPDIEARAIKPNKETHGIKKGALLAWQINRVAQYVESHLELKIGTEHLCAVAKLSPSHFCRAFRVSQGESPHEFVMRRRVERSQELMLASRAALVHIATDCGFADQAHFSRVHRKLVGMTPGAWRRNQQATQL
jgi:AraC family transcriptional regulator